MYKADSNSQKSTAQKSEGLQVESSKDGVKCSSDNSDTIVENIEFAVGDSVVYPSHGVGRITGVEKQEIAGYNMELYAIEFSEDSMILRVPKARAVKAGLRPLCSKETLKEAIDVLKQRPQNNRGMWSKRAQDYDMKINSGDIVQISQVLRDLYRDDSADPERSYSERLVYEAALERLIVEYAIVEDISKDDARTKILEILETASIVTAAA